MEGTQFSTCIFNEPTLFYTVAVCTAAGIAHQRYIALECQSHSTSCTDTSVLSHVHQHATRRATQLAVGTN